jgi:transcriptional regulator GlxA family with amidase domain
MDHRITKVTSMMRENPHQGWPATRLAQVVNMSPSRLHQLFKNDLGVPPAKFLRVLRLERAKELLETSYLSVKQVMVQVGVTDGSHFVRNFKKAYGCTPANYRGQVFQHESTDAEADLAVRNMQGH